MINRLLHFIVLMILATALAVFSTACASETSLTPPPQSSASDTNLPVRPTDAPASPTEPSDSDDTTNTPSDSADSDKDSNNPDTPTTPDDNTDESTEPSNPDDTNETQKPEENPTEKSIFEGTWYGWLYDMMDGLYEYRIVIDSDGSVVGDSYYRFTFMGVAEQNNEITITIIDDTLTVNRENSMDLFVLNSERNTLTAEHFISEDFEYVFALTKSEILSFDELDEKLTNAYEDETATYIFEYADMFGTLEITDETIYEIIYINNHTIYLSDNIIDDFVTLIFDSDKLYYGEIELIKQ